MNRAHAFRAPPATYHHPVSSRPLWRNLIAYVRAWAGETDDENAAREMILTAREAEGQPCPCEGVTPEYAFDTLRATARKVAQAPVALRAPWGPALLALADLCDHYLAEQQTREAQSWKRWMADD